jgi:hypothetical protein
MFFETSGIGHGKIQESRIRFAKKLDAEGILDVFGKKNFHDLQGYQGELNNDDPSTVLSTYQYYFMTKNSDEKIMLPKKYGKPFSVKHFVSIGDVPT